MKVAKCINVYYTLNIKQNPLTLGRLYKIVSPNNGGMMRVIDDNGRDTRYNSRRFKIVDLGLNTNIKIL